MSKERRAYPRVALTVAVDLESGSNFYTGQTRDISVGGLFIETEVAIPVGDELVVRVALGGKALNLATQVMWAMADTSGKNLGVGLRFVRLAPVQRKAIEAFMAQRGPMDFEVEAEDDEFERPAEREAPKKRPRKK